MPVYEYRCQECRRRFSVFWRSFSNVDESKVACKRCGSRQVARLMSRVRVVRAGDSRMADLGDPSTWGDFDENDPKSMGRLMRRMMNEVGDEAGELGPEFEEVVDRLESGQDPEEIEKAIPELGGGAGSDDESDV